MLEVIVKKVNKEEVIVTSTLDVAETFCKEHKEVIYAIEGIIRKDLPEKVKEKMFFIGFMFIIFLLLLSNINDIIRIFE